MKPESMQFSDGAGFDRLCTPFRRSKHLLTEADDDTGDEADAGDDTGDDTGDDMDDEGGDEEEVDKANDEPPAKKPFEQLELIDASCFGWCPNASTLCWVNIAEQSISKGWNKCDIRRLDVDLKKNVDACYFFPCQGTFKDLDTEYVWRAVFVADHAMWRLDLPESENAEVLPEDAKAFFSSEYFMKFAKRCGDIIDKANVMFEQTVRRRVESGELLQVDAVKLERILKEIKVDRFMMNLRQGKYEFE